MPDPQDLSKQYELGDDAQTATPEPVVAQGDAVAPLAQPTQPVQNAQGRWVDPVTKKFVAAPAAQEQPPAPQAHPEYLARRAADLGISREEIEGTPTSELRQIIRDYQLDALMNERRLAFEQASQPAAVASQAQAAAAPPPEDYGELENLNPDLTRILRAQADTIRQLQARLDRVEPLAGASAQETQNQRLDRAFGVLNNGTRYGADRPDPRSAEMGRRLAVLNEAQRLAGPKASLEQVVSKLREADRNIYGDAPQTEPTQDRTAQQDRWNRGGLVKPTHRVGASELKPEGVEKARESVADYLAKNGSTTDQPTSMDEFLP